MIFLVFLFQLMNHNDKWKTICESMKREIEEAKRQLEETCRASSADRETQHDGKSDSVRHISL
jgi:hypothetical protein